MREVAAGTACVKVLWQVRVLRLKNSRRLAQLEGRGKGQVTNVERSWLSKLAIAGTKHHDQKQLEAKGVYFILYFHITVLCPSSKGSQGWSSRQGSGDRNWSRSRRGMPLTGSLSVACSVCRLLAHRTTNPGVAGAVSRALRQQPSMN